MQGRSNLSRRRRRWLASVAGALLALPLAGCGDFWDTVTSHDFQFKNLYTSENPLIVLRDSDDGDKRAKAMRMLREPLQTGGTQADQEFVMKVLGEAAVSARQPLCRLAAIQKLGTFKDPRAAHILVQAFQNASEFPNSAVAGGKKAAEPGALPSSVYNASGISVDMPTQIRCVALTALGQTHNPEGLKLLATVVREPVSVGADEDRQQALDIRLAAARALGNYKDPQAAVALVEVFKSARDVALKDRVYESLQASTGQKLPPDPAKWDALVHNPAQPPPGQPDDGPKLVGWFKKLMPGQ